MALANVVGMVVSIKKKEGSASLLLNSKKNAVGKLFFSFPEDKDCEASYTMKMLMLDG
jgi:hypothetical protein